MRGRLKEYRGEKIVTQLSAKLLPPDLHYPDCICLLVLTDRHLYVLEDNFDGTYEMHFEFVLSRIDGIEIETWEQISTGKDSKENLPVFAAILTYWCSVMFSVPIGKPNRAVKEKYIVIKYHTEQGKKEKIYFHLPDGAKPFIKSFEKVKADYGQGCYQQ
ncbi:hypothetical protein AALA79_06045 [Lachnospiraceae bacterium 64-25]|nr:hypothetical protein IMSAGC005_02470 [Lachnospiraceae bacterium]GFI44288.1 hypothetical protein IMSAGC018_01969 [Lachnospiraceae bacterium]